MKSKTIPKLFLLTFFLVSLSCSKTEENVPLTTPTAQISVDKIAREASLRNQEIPFTIIDENGNDVTELATFFVNGEAIDGFSFSSSEIGEFDVYAVYIQDGVEITTNTETFRVIIPKQKIVVEDYTGTWCGFCPRVAGAVEHLKDETSDVVLVAIHETANSFPDPMHFDQVQILKDEYGIEGFPAAKINRGIDWPVPHNLEDVISIAGVDTNIAIALNSELVDGELLVQVNVVYEDGSQPGDKLVVYLLEDGILYDQVNYYNYDSTSEFYEMGDPIPNFEHNEVLRASMTDVLGNTIPSTGALTEYITSFSYTVPSNYVVENLSVAAMVVGEDNVAKNAQYAHVNEDKSYE